MGLKTILGLRAPRHVQTARKKRSREYLASYGFLPATVIDVGVAAKGTPWLYDAFPTAALVLVDPLEDGEVVADRLRNQHRNVNFVRAAAGAEHGMVTVNRHVEDSKSTLLEWRGARAKEIVAQAEVPLRPLDALAAGAHGPIGLKIDVEGYELEVLRGAVETLDRSEFVIVECSIQRRFEGGAEFHEVVGYLANRGFRVLDILNAPRGNRPKQMDFVFVEKDSPLLQADA